MNNHKNRNNQSKRNQQNKQVDGPSIDPTRILDDPDDLTYESTGIKAEVFIKDEMDREMKNIFGRLCVENDIFDAENTYEALKEYINKYDRIIYSTVSQVIYSITNVNNENNHFTNQNKFSTLLSNMDKLLTYVGKQANEDLSANTTETETDAYTQLEKDTRKAVWKIWDHINLAHIQFEVLRQSDDEYNEKFEERIQVFQNKITSEMNAQLLSMVGIFTALAFLLFGGINSLQNVLTGLQDSHLLRLLIIGGGWGLVMLNVTFVFLFCISKMTKLNFKSSQNPSATFCQRYPVVCWTNFLIISIMCILMWMYYLTNRGSDSVLELLITRFPISVGLFGFIILIVVIIVGFIVLVKKTKPDQSNFDD